jgi:hypothetical protein
MITLLMLKKKPRRLFLFSSHLKNGETYSQPTGY